MERDIQNSLQTNFSGGELAPSMQGYVNLKEYINGLLTEQNFVNDNNGGVFFRQGTYYAADTAGDATCKIVPFIFNKLQAYQLEFTAGRIRFYTNNGQEQVSNNVSAASWAGGTATVTIGAHVFLAGDTVTVAGITPSGYNGAFVLSSVTGTAIKYAVANPGAYSSGGTARGAYQIVSPYTGSGSIAIAPNSWAQTDDVMYLFEGHTPVQQLIRLGAANWTIAPISPIMGPFMQVNTSAGSLMSTSGTGGVNVANSSQIFSATDVGRQILMLDSTGSYQGSAGTWKWAIITAFTDTTHVTVDNWRQTVAAKTTANLGMGAGLAIASASWAANVVVFNVSYNTLQVGMKFTVTGVNPSAYNGTYTITARKGGAISAILGSNPGSYVSGGTLSNTNTQDWALGAWSTTTGYPTCGSFHQQRLVYGGATSDSLLSATTFGGSMVGLYTTFCQFDPDGTVNPDNAFTFQIASGRADGIQWMIADKYLEIGTGAAEYTVQSSGPAITPTDVNVVAQTSLGSSGVSPAQMNYRLVIPQRGNQFLHQWVYNWQVGGFIAQMINKSADHICGPGISRIVYQLNPVPRLWAVRTDGQVIVGTDTGDGWAFGRLVLGGAFGAGSPVVEDISVIPTATYDQIWLVVKRTVNGQTVRFVEYITSPWDGVMADAFFVDAGLQYSGAPTTTLTGLGYLNGQTVAILGDGVSQGTQVVPGTGILTVTSASKFSVGLVYSGYCQSLQLSDQTIQGRRQYAIRAFLRLLNTFGGYILSGKTYATQRPLKESATSLYTGSSKQVLDHGTDTEQHLVFGQQSPYPMTVLNASIDFRAGDS